MNDSTPDPADGTLKRLLKKLGAAKVKRLLIWLRNNIYYRGNKLYCPVCQRGSSRFMTYGIPPRINAECVWCGAKERHRFVWAFWLSGRTNLFENIPGRQFLHLAPEIFFEQRLRDVIGSGYITADYSAPYAQIKMDIQAIQFEDETFDIIYCSHVMEHVDDDRKALAEFYRVLVTGGWAVLMVPDYAEKTIEDPTIKDPQERLRLFRQTDHVRLYGPDFADRVREAGFEVSVLLPPDIFSPDEIAKMALIKDADRIYYCRKN